MLCCIYNDHHLWRDWIYSSNDHLLIGESPKNSFFVRGFPLRNFFFLNIFFYFLFVAVLLTSKARGAKGLSGLSTKKRTFFAASLTCLLGI